MRCDVETAEMVRRNVDGPCIGSLISVLPTGDREGTASGVGRQVFEGAGAAADTRDDSIAVDFLPIARTKITPVPVRETTLSRPRLLVWLGDNSHRRAIVIAAEAGYGKTTLVADYARLGRSRCLWYKLDPTDRDWVTFSHYVVASVREVEPEFGRRTASLLGNMATGAPSRDIVIDTLVAEVSRLGSQPTLFILDDYQHVDGSGDVEEIIGRLLANAPPSWCFLFLSRRNPALAMARLAAQGDLASLNTAELRFSRDETDRLFRETFGQPLDPDLIERIDARTEGWVASLQLLYSSIRGRPAIEVRRFVDALTGATGPLYDFLAQELMGALEPPMRRFITHAALLDRVVPELVVAMFDEQAGNDIAKVRAWINEAEELGLLSSRGEGSGQFHPLLREFLLVQLAESVSELELRSLHRRVAIAAEPSDWQAACRHYLEAGEPNEAMRVLSDSVLVALGTGQWGAAGSLVERLGSVEQGPQVRALAALREVHEGRPESGLAELLRIHNIGQPPMARAAVRHSLYRAYWGLGDLDSVSRVTRETLADEDTPEPLKDIASVQGIVAGQPVYLGYGAELLENLAAKQGDAGLPFFQAISLHNAMTFRLHQGSYALAQRDGEEALGLLEETETAAKETPATHATLAVVCAEQGGWALAADHSRRATAASVADPDALAEAAYLSAVSGRVSEADALLDRAARLMSSASTSATSRSTADIHRAVTLRAAGKPEAAIKHLEACSGAWGIGSALALRSQLAIAWASAEPAQSLSHLGSAIEEAELRGSSRWLSRLLVAACTARHEWDRLPAAIQQAAETGHLALLDTAELVVSNLHTLAPLPEAIGHSFKEAPERWLPLLRRQLDKGRTHAGTAVVEALAEYGTAADGPRIRAYERTYLSARRATGLAKKLARRVSPVLDIHDLGRTWIAVADRRVGVSEMRRKAAALLLYLVSRRNAVAARDQVLEALWPDLTPEGASNSLSQTLYFLRRHIDPWYDEHLSMPYVHAESETLWLDEERVRVDSILFESLARQYLGHGGLQAGRASLDLYTGPLAVEFEYEEWATGPRDRLHALFLQVEHLIYQELAAAKLYDDAANVAREALSIDPEAIDVERQLVWLYATMGAGAAAVHQWSHFAIAHRDQLGAEPPTIDQIRAGPP